LKIDKMFTGIIQAIGKVEDIKKEDSDLTISVSVPKDWNIAEGESISVDGVCLTAIGQEKECCLFQLMPETIRIINPKEVGESVNLERAMLRNERFGGHIVQGHVDETGVISKVQNGSLTIEYPKGGLVALKGSICIDGVSLTVSSHNEEEFTVSLIKYTMEHTTLGSKKEGDIVNLEYDIIGKYIQHDTR